MKRNNDILKRMEGYILSSGTTRVDQVALEFGMNRRTCQNYIQIIKANNPAIVSIPGRSGGITVTK